MRIAFAPLAAMSLVISTPAGAQYTPATPTIASIWPANTPGLSRRNEPEIARDYWVRNIHDPSLTIFRPGRQNGAAVIVIPGGGHKLIVWTTEGVNVAQALNRYGLTAFVLKYRLAQEEGSTSTLGCGERRPPRNPLGARPCAGLWRGPASCRDHGIFRRRRARLAGRGQSSVETSAARRCD